MATTPSLRFGGELPAGCDPLQSAADISQTEGLTFSHGRAAITWLHRHRGPFRSAAVCAYTCPSVIEHLEWMGLKVDLFDVGGDVSAVVEGLPSPCLVLVPSLFGWKPWLDVQALARHLGDQAMVVIDAAQTAFGHLDFLPPWNGAVLSGPRKTLAISNGAILRLERESLQDARSVAILPLASEAADYKTRARILFASGNLDDEAEAVRCNHQAERLWPAEPHRMSDAAKLALSMVDAAEHRRRRCANRAQLSEALAHIPSLAADFGVPFCHPILVENRAAALPKLHALRVFATPLWPDARHDPKRHPVAADLAHRLVALTVDQRYDPGQMTLLAKLVSSCLG